MSKRQATWEEIKALAADGWRFRKKIRKGRLYISARKGRDEHGLGLYSDEFWNMIVDVTRSSTENPQPPMEVIHTQTGLKETDDPLIETLKEIKRNINRYAFLHCLHVEADEFCYYWRLEDLPKQARRLNDAEFKAIFKRVSQDDGKTKVWLIKPYPIICDNCPGFIDEKTIDLINSYNKKDK